MHDRLLEWFDAHGRSLPGRDVREPWRVLVLEVMSQQTQIDRCLRARDEFCERFPIPAALAAATPADALRAWAGLGYNRRALALRRAAQVAVERHGGTVPATIDALGDLPGVGPYTARAVAARAFGARVVPVDVNVRRVLARILGTSSVRSIQAYADALAQAPEDGASSGVFPGTPEAGNRTGGAIGARVADALMDLAASVCRPRHPRCAECPLRIACVSAFAETARPQHVPAVPAERPFPETRRWLRGQILRELRDAPAGAWVPVEGERGSHGHVSVREAVSALAAEGFVEIDAEGRARLSET
ncbi:MAG: A/G-specific adenine glycosylase [Chloroflexi bacterium]|nr:A/G-specific adenine glycosylase [Chloroflexota bacterium]